MEHLRRRDLKTLLNFLQDTYTLRDQEAFGHHIVSALRKIVSSEIADFHASGARISQTSQPFVDPPEFITPEIIESFFRTMSQNPLVTAFSRTSDGHALKVSDFFTRQQFLRTELYNEHYRPYGQADQMAISISTPPSVAASRPITAVRSRNFTEKERLILNLLRPHLRQAFLNSQAVTKMQTDLTSLTQAVEMIDRGVVVLTREGRVRLMTPQAWQWVTEYFGRSSPANCLPETLERWVRHQKAVLAVPDDVPPPVKPLVVEREGKKVVVRLVTDGAGDLLLLEEKQVEGIPLAIKERFGLTAREAEVLHWVAEGKTNIEIGIILSMSPRTVQKHLEHTFQKLGVETRTAAATLVLSADGYGGYSP